MFSQVDYVLENDIVQASTLTCVNAWLQHCGLLGACKSPAAVRADACALLLPPPWGWSFSIPAVALVFRFVWRNSIWRAFSCFTSCGFHVNCRECACGKMMVQLCILRCLSQKHHTYILTRQVGQHWTAPWPRNPCWPACCSSDAAALMLAYSLCCAE